MLWSQQEILACRVLSSHFQRERCEAESKQTVSALHFSLPKTKTGNLFIQTERTLGIQFPGCTRISFPPELLPHRLLDPEGRPFSNAIFSNLLFPNSYVTENTNPYLREHRGGRASLPTAKFWSFRRWMRSLRSPCALNEQDEVGLMSGSAIEERTPGSRQFVCIYNREYKISHILPAYLRHIGANKTMVRLKKLLALGSNVELVVPSFLTDLEMCSIDGSVRFDRTYSSTSVFPMVDDNVACVLNARVTLSTLCTVFAGAFLLSREADWLRK